MDTHQQFCLRWNNHSTNLVSMFDEQLQNEAFTDVTLVCEGGEHLRCHKMVLAACSTYFQNVFVNYPCKHPLVVLKDIKPKEMRAILAYMYHGEVNVTQDQIQIFLKVATALQVKGLIEGLSDSGASIMNHHNNDDDRMDPSPPGLEHSHVHSSSSSVSPPHSTSSLYKYKSPYMYSASKAPAAFRERERERDRERERERERDRDNGTNRLNLPMWAIPGIPMPSQGGNSTSVGSSNPHHQAAAAMLSSCYEAADMSPLKRKKLSSLLMNSDTPILRNVLGQGQSQADSSQPVSLVCHPDSRDQNSNGPDDRLHKRLKNEPSEDAQSPYTDFSAMNEEDDKSKLAIPSSSPQSYNSQDLQRVSSAIATYVPTQKPEWKRYKQYTRNDICSAIEAVRNGMSALQAARKYGVPSRTLYDKVKKLGITTSRPFKRGSNGSSASFPYGLSGTGSPYSGHLSENDDAPTNNNTSLLEATFLQHAFEGRGGDEREALTAAMAMAAAAAQAAVAGRHSNSSPPNRHATSPSPSPTLLKYMRHNRNSLTPSPVPGSEHQHSETNGSSERDREEDDCDQVEDLSIGRNKQPQESRVIMPPMSNQVSTIMKKEELLKDMIKQEARMEIKIEDRGE